MLHSEKTYCKRSVSIGSILNLKSFFITYATEKEMSLSTFLNHSCDCPKSTNGYFQWACSTRQCQNCKNSKPAALKCQTLDDMVTVSQFEPVVKEYPSINKQGEVVMKKTKLTERVSCQITYKDLYKKLT